jgi:hypothetical protein
MSSSLRIPRPKIGDLELMARIAREDRMGTGVTLPWTPERDRCVRMGWIRSNGRIGPTGTPGRDGRRALFGLTDDGRGWVDRAARLMPVRATIDQDAPREVL